MWTPTATGLRQTDGRIRDQAVERQVEALDNAESYQSSTVEVADHSTESVGDIKKVEALGALKLLSGGSASLAAVDDLHQATGRDLNLVVGQKHNAVGGDKNAGAGPVHRRQIQGLRKSVSQVSQHLEAPKTWVGSSGVNVLKVLCDLIDLVEQMNIQLASHTWADTEPDGCQPVQRQGRQALLLAGQLKLLASNADAHQARPLAGFSCHQDPAERRYRVTRGRRTLAPGKFHSTKKPRKGTHFSPSRRRALREFLCKPWWW